MKYGWMVWLCCFSSALQAANVSITPTRVVLTPAHNTALLTFTNNGDKPLTLQIMLNTWQQAADGRAVVEESRALTVFPKMLRIDSGQARPVRLGFDGQWRETEQAFRIFADELPSVDVQTGAVGVVFPVRLSIPIFVRQQEQAADAQMALTLAELQHGELRVQVHNPGQQHFALDSLEATLLGAEEKALAVVKMSGGRVLATSSVFFSAPVEAAVCAQATAVAVRAVSQAVSQQQHFSLAKPSCQTP